MANEDDHPPAAKSAEDRKAASALANLDASADDAPATNPADIDHEAITKAMKGLPADLSSASASSAAAKGVASGGASKQGSGSKPSAKKNIKLDPDDVALIVNQLDLSKSRASELLKQHDGSAVAVIRMFAAGYRE